MWFLLILALINSVSAMNRTGEQILSQAIPQQCEEPEMLFRTEPVIEGRNVLITTWVITSRTHFSLYFSFVFDRDTNTPDRPIYILQGFNFTQATENHESATVWTHLQIRPISPLDLSFEVHYASENSTDSLIEELIELEMLDSSRSNSPSIESQIR